MLNHIDLASFYRLNFELKNTNNDYPFTIQEIEDLYPFERDIYISLLQNYLSEKEEASKNS